MALRESLCACWLTSSYALVRRGRTAEKRVALVIGNSNYRDVPVLANPRNDAEDVAAALKRL